MSVAIVTLYTYASHDKAPLEGVSGWGNSNMLNRRLSVIFEAAVP